MNVPRLKVVAVPSDHLIGSCGPTCTVWFFHLSYHVPSRPSIWSCDLIIWSYQSTAPEVYNEFVAGNFVIRRSKSRFNQVPVDQAIEWMNRMCKISNGIIGITRNDTARDRFCATWSERSKVSQDAKALFGLVDEDRETEAISHRKEALPSRQKHDEHAVMQLVQQFQRFDVLRINPRQLVDSVDMDLPGDDASVKEATLVSLASNDIATVDIQDDILSARERGETLVKENVKKRLLDQSVPFFNPLQRNKTRTFGSLYKCSCTVNTNEKKAIKVDSKLIQQLFNASRAGREVDMSEILKHEISPFPLSLAKINGEMNSSAKSDLLNLLTKDLGLETSTEVPCVKQNINSCVVIDGHAMIQALGKPANCNTFSEYAEVFLKGVSRNFSSSVTRIDVTFDRYIGSMSTKAPTRKKRVGSKRRPIRKIIDRDDVPLPQVWAQFISLHANKAGLAHYLSDYLMKSRANLTPNQEIVIGGGFVDSAVAKSTKHGLVRQLSGDHEEADTRIVLHAQHAVSCGYGRILVQCKDTDVLLLLIHFFNRQSVELWMVSGTAKQRKCYPVSQIAQNLSQPVVNNILGFHALTGCDTTSSFTGFSKKSAWKLYVERPDLLEGDGAVGPAEEFICLLYSAANPSNGINEARNLLFGKGKRAIETLLPTKDAFYLHFARANFQAKVWLNATNTQMNVGSAASTGGWQENDGRLEVVWTSLPSVPHACIELVTCGCKSKCKSASCKCSKSGQICIPACGCNAENCRNPARLHSLEDEAD